MRKPPEMKNIVFLRVDPENIQDVAGVIESNISNGEQTKILKDYKVFPEQGFIVWENVFFHESCYEVNNLLCYLFDNMNFACIEFYEEYGMNSFFADNNIGLDYGLVSSFLDNIKSIYDITIRDVENILNFPCNNSPSMGSM